MNINLNDYRQKSGGMTREEFDKYRAMIDRRLEEHDRDPLRGSFGWTNVKYKLEEEKMNLYHHTLGRHCTGCDIDFVATRYGVVKAVIDYASDIDKKQSSTAKTAYHADLSNNNILHFIEIPNSDFTQFAVRNIVTDERIILSEADYRSFKQNFEAPAGPPEKGEIAGPLGEGVY